MGAIGLAIFLLGAVPYALLLGPLHVSKWWFDGRYDSVEFRPEAWRAAGESGSDARRAMLGSLERQLRSRRWSLEELDALLGPGWPMANGRRYTLGSPLMCGLDDLALEVALDAEGNLRVFEPFCL